MTEFKFKGRENAYRREWYAKNRDKVYATNERYRKQIRQWYLDLKRNQVCSRCGFADWRALQFHHASGDKDRAIAVMVSHSCSKQKILLEIAKCEVLCANCHQIEHYAP